MLRIPLVFAVLFGLILMHSNAMACQQPFPTVEDNLSSFAKKLLHKPYKAGGNTPSGFDTSGFIQYVFKNSNANISLPRIVADQFKKGKSVSKPDLLPADLVFFKINGKLQSVGIFIDGNTFVTVTIKKGVALQNLNTPYWKENYFGAKRIIHPSPATVKKIKEIYSLAKQGLVEGGNGVVPGSKKADVIKKWGKPDPNLYPNDNEMAYNDRKILLNLKNEKVRSILKHDSGFNEMDIKKSLSGIIPDWDWSAYSGLTYKLGEYSIGFNYYEWGGTYSIVKTSDIIY